MIADEEDLTWTFIDSFDCENTVIICTDNYDETVIVLSDDMYSVQDVPELIKALKQHMTFTWNIRRIHEQYKRMAKCSNYN